MFSLFHSFYFCLENLIGGRGRRERERKREVGGEEEADRKIERAEDLE